MVSYVKDPIKGKLYRARGGALWSHYRVNNPIILSHVPPHSIVIFLACRDPSSLWSKVIFKDLVGWIYSELEEYEEVCG